MAAGPSSLTKNLPLAALERTLTMARHAMPYKELLAIARSRTHGDAAGILAGRFLLVENGSVVRDHFLSIVENEGVGSTRVRKIMYGLWALRDQRLRNFVTQRIAGGDGRWRPEEVARIANKNFFTGSSRQKVRSNIERFLEQTGIWDSAMQLVHLDRSDGWLEDSILAAAQHVQDRKTRFEMTSDPIGYLVRHRMHGLADATVENLQATPALMPVSEPGQADVDPTATVLTGNSRQWSRLPPTPNQRSSAIVTSNPVALERANRAHFEIEKDLAGYIERLGRIARCNANIDVFFSGEHGATIFEIKSCHARSFQSQVRRGVSQLLEYRFRYKDELGGRVSLVLLVETPPPPMHRWMIRYLNELQILLAWRSNSGRKFECSDAIAPELRGIIRQI